MMFIPIQVNSYNTNRLVQITMTNLGWLILFICMNPMLLSPFVEINSNPVLLCELNFHPNFFGALISSFLTFVFIQCLYFGLLLCVQTCVSLLLFGRSVYSVPAPTKKQLKRQTKDKKKEFKRLKGQDTRNNKTNNTLWFLFPGKIETFVVFCYNTCHRVVSWCQFFRVWLLIKKYNSNRITQCLCSVCLFVTRVLPKLGNLIYLLTFSFVVFVTPVEASDRPLQYDFDFNNKYTYLSILGSSLCMLWKSYCHGPPPPPPPPPPPSPPPTPPPLPKKTYSADMVYVCSDNNIHMFKLLHEDKTIEVLHTQLHEYPHLCDVIGVSSLVSISSYPLNERITKIQRHHINHQHSSLAHFRFEL